MKPPKNLLALLAVLALLVLPVNAALRDSVTLAWNYPDPSDIETFVIYSSDDAAAPLPWAKFRDVPAKDADGKTVTEYTIKPIAPGKHFFYVTAKNFWGESDPSNVAGTPGAPGRGILTIK
jgi:hypothetical protein